MYVIRFLYNDKVTAVKFKTYVAAMKYYWENIDKGPSIHFSEES